MSDLSRFQTRHRVIPAVYIIFRDGDKVLLLRRANTGYFDGSYSLPAGHIEAEETAIKAAIREAQEEVGIKLSSDNLRLVHTMCSISVIPVRHDRIALYFEATKWVGKPVNKETKKCDELRWCLTTALPTNLVLEGRQALEKVAAGEPYSDYGFSSNVLSGSA